MKALVIGATGAVGKVLVRQLLCDDYFTEVDIFIRSEWDIQHPKLVTHIVDFEEIDQWAHLITGDIAYSCLGTTRKQAGSKERQKHIDYDYVMQFAQYCKGNGVKTFAMVSSIGANDKSTNFYTRVKGQLERVIFTLRFNSTVIVRPSLLIRPHSDRWVERASIRLLKWLNALGIMKRFKPVSLTQVSNCIREESKRQNCKIIIVENVYI
ncbi:MULTISPECIES: NAD(P)H-binding protein [Myroides]|uniref:NAD(P)H-binding protein n=1 Tax=Myroides albus TaxID=2562892 RepID=A0A6I3LIW0_9FLAO|nr:MULTISPECIES: NAD(P)H-binding protein [Myroides]MTG97526.1 NAD(P)H-binding protein [Myroides albus]MVX35050.1 NAD(P)H-binding protein [Myroides sp. LoEW2-1]UVD81197.1 NAD(P)H-binding protein [Myroides albus]